VRRVVLLATIFLLFCACDPLRKVSVSVPIPRLIGQHCLVETLRMEKTVRTVELSDPKRVWAELLLPPPLESPRGDDITWLFIEEQKNDKGEIEITFRTNWLGSPGSPAYRAYLERTIGELRDQTIERCGGK